MKEEKMIRISLQLPVSELAAVSELAEKLRSLMQGGESYSAPTDGDHNEAFDAERFQALQRTESTADLSPLPDSRTADVPVMQEIAAQQEPPTRFEEEAQDMIRSEVISDMDTPPVQQADIAAEIETSWEETAAVTDDLLLPTSAGFSVSDADPDFSAKVLQEKEHPAMNAPVPLTAESVALAFRRDDRRYDNGFPLY